jgi:hypothetical protein
MDGYQDVNDGWLALAETCYNDRQLSWNRFQLDRSQDGYTSLLIFKALQLNLAKNLSLYFVTSSGYLTTSMWKS